MRLNAWKHGQWESRMAMAAGILTALSGGGYLAAWLGGVMAERGVSAISMKTNTSLCLLLLGLALVVLVNWRGRVTMRWMVRTLAGISLLIGGLTLAENLFGWDFGIDQLLASEPPGALGILSPNRMGTPASFCIVLASLALLLLARSRAKGAKSCGACCQPRSCCHSHWVDVIDTADSLAELLAMMGHEVRAAYDGVTALQLAGQFRPDVILLDIGLPGMNGFEVARHIRREPALEGALLVALTGYGQEEDRRKAEEAGFDGHFTKPVELRAVQDVLERLDR